MKNNAPYRLILELEKNEIIELCENIVSQLFHCSFLYIENGEYEKARRYEELGFAFLDTLDAIKSEK